MGFRFGRGYSADGESGMVVASGRDRPASGRHSGGAVLPDAEARTGNIGEGRSSKTSVGGTPNAAGRSEGVGAGHVGNAGKSLAVNRKSERPVRSYSPSGVPRASIDPNSAVPLAAEVADLIERNPLEGLKMVRERGGHVLEYIDEIVRELEKRRNTP